MIFPKRPSYGPKDATTQVLIQYFYWEKSWTQVAFLPSCNVEKIGMKEFWAYSVVLHWKEEQAKTYLKLQQISKMESSAAIIAITAKLSISSVCRIPGYVSDKVNNSYTLCDYTLKVASRVQIWKKKHFVKIVTSWVTVL